MSIAEREYIGRSQITNKRKECQINLAFLALSNDLKVLRVFKDFKDFKEKTLLPDLKGGGNRRRDLTAAGIPPAA